MPSKSQAQRGLIFGKRNQYKSKAKTPDKWKWIWDEDWENKGKLPKKIEENFEDDENIDVLIKQLADSVHTSLDTQYNIVKDWLQSGRYIMGEDLYPGISEEHETANEIINNLIDAGYLRFEDNDYPEGDIILNDMSETVQNVVMENMRAKTINESFNESDTYDEDLHEFKEGDQVIFYLAEEYLSDWDEDDEDQYEIAHSHNAQIAIIIDGGIPSDDYYDIKFGDGSILYSVHRNLLEHDYEDLNEYNDMSEDFPGLFVGQDQGNANLNVNINKMYAKDFDVLDKWNNIGRVKIKDGEEGNSIISFNLDDDEVFDLLEPYISYENLDPYLK